MATMTVTLTVTWATAEDQTNSGWSPIRKEKIQAMVAAGQTDNQPVIVSPTVTERAFSDQSAAEEYGNWLISTAPTIGVTPPTYTTAPI